MSASAPLQALKIGALVLPYPQLLAPMASLTDRALRTAMAPLGGLGALVTEMISVEAFRKGNTRTREMTDCDDLGLPQFIQLFGHDPQAFAAAAARVEAEGFYSGIDINFGCPARKVLRRGAGAAMLDDPLKMAALIRAVRRASSRPLTVKTRLGYRRENFAEWLPVIDSEGVDALIVHFRLGIENYSMEARWERAAAIRARLKIPLIGNGDLRNPEMIHNCLESVDGVMVGRGGLADPWLFARSAGLKPGPNAYLSFARNYCRLLEEFHQPRLRLNKLKNFSRFLLPGLAAGRSRKKAVFLAQSWDEARDLFLDFLAAADGQLTTQSAF